MAATRAGSWEHFLRGVWLQGLYGRDRLRLTDGSLPVRLSATSPGYPQQVTAGDAKEAARRQALAAQAAQAAEDLADAPAQDVIAWAVEALAERICITSSMTDA